MQRRKFLGVLGASVLSFSPALAQPSRRRIGVLVGTPDTDPEALNRINGFVVALKALGWVEGSNLEVIKRFGGGRPENLPSLASDLVAQHVDLIVTEAAQATDAAHRATSK